MIRPNSRDMSLISAILPFTMAVYKGINVLRDCCMCALQCLLQWVRGSSSPPRVGLRSLGAAGWEAPHWASPSPHSPWQPSAPSHTSPHLGGRDVCERHVSFFLSFSFSLFFVFLFFSVFSSPPSTQPVHLSISFTPFRTDQWGLSWLRHQESDSLLLCQPINARHWFQLHHGRISV